MDKYKNIFNTLEKYSKNISIINRYHENISYTELLSKSDDLGKIIKKRCLIFLMCSNSIETILGYIGFGRASAVQLLINSSMQMRI